MKGWYVRGLGCVLHKVSNGNPNMRLLFEQWGYSILNTDVSTWFQSEDTSFIKKAISLNRDGLRFFRLKHQFYFDCFYLTETFDSSLLNKLNEYLAEFGSNLFTKKALKRTYNFFAGNTGSLNVEESLLKHRNDNRAFGEKYENSVLVVATVSAGKSTLINALTGSYFNKVKNGACTSRICKIHNKPVTDGITYRKDNVLNYDANIESKSSEDTSEAAMHFVSSIGAHRVCLIDTPGVNNSRDHNHMIITSDAVKGQNFDMVIFISNGQYNGTNDERQLLNLLHTHNKKPVLFVLNQLDCFKNGVDDIAKMIADYRKELTSIGFDSPKVFPVSARYAYLLNTETSLDEEEQEELAVMRHRFSKAFFDLNKYIESESEHEYQKTGLKALENEIIKLLK